MRWLAMLAMVGLVFAACGGSEVTPDATPQVDASFEDPPRETITTSALMVPTEILEAILAGGEPGDYARIKLMAPAPELDWNIHGHAGGDTQVVAEDLNQMTVDYSFVPTASADWFLLLRNSGPTDMMVTLEIDLYGNMTWSGFQ